MVSLPFLDIPPSLNYIAVFLTLRCHLNCSYCINDPQQEGVRKKLFKREKASLAPEEWVRGLSRIPYSDDLPLTLQGGEPMIYWGGEGVGEILKGLPHHFDLLTAFPYTPEKFSKSLQGQEKKFMRDAPYPSIRVSYHPEQMEKVWHEKGFEELVDRCAGLAEFGFRVSPNKSESDVGIYMVEHPDNHISTRMEDVYRGRVPFEAKEFLGEHDEQLYGTYLYPYSTNLISSGTWDKSLSCECRTTELLLDPLGFAWGCHFHLYDSWSSGGPLDAFEALVARGYHFMNNETELFEHGKVSPIGHILDPDFSLETLKEFRPCHDYGHCIGCDTKVKNNRFQSLDDEDNAHTSVEIINIDFPDIIKKKLKSA